MFDLTLLRDNFDGVAARLVHRLADAAVLADLLDADRRLRETTAEAERLQAERRRLARRIGRPADSPEVAAARDVARRLGDRLAELRSACRELDERRRALWLQVPNLPHPDIPDGPDASANVVVRRWGTPPAFAFPPRRHDELGKGLGLDLDAGSRVTGHGFPVLTGPLARLELALIGLMVDVHTRRGYTPVLVPDLVNRASAETAGQLPKFARELYHVAEDDLYLVPTAETALASLHRGEVLDARALPLRYVGVSPCFRREAGAGGADQRGILRVHQFHKCELFAYVDPARSDEALKGLVRDAEVILRLLELPHRVVLLASGDMGFSAQMTYDLEVWLPGQADAQTGRMGTYREVSSCSNVGDFQARRGTIRYQPADGGPLGYVHMLNGSGLAVGRTLVAILENYQEPDGTVRVPTALRPYLGGRTRLEPGAGRACTQGRARPARAGGPHGAEVGGGRMPASVRP